jgi:hypothetical protein
MSMAASTSWREGRAVRHSLRPALTAARRVVAGAAFVASVGAPALAAAPDAGAPCEARRLAFDDQVAGWAHVPLSKLKRDTVYSVGKDGERAELRAEANRSASLYVAPLKPALRTPATLAWEWKTDALVPGADSRDRKREDAPLRVLVAFDGDLDTLPAEEKKRFQRARSLTGRTPPYAVLMYIWTDHVPVGTVIPSAHTSQVKMLAVASGRAHLGSWQAVERDLAEDYRKAFGAEPGPVSGIAAMTDTDNTGQRAVGHYAGIRIACASR